MRITILVLCLLNASVAAYGQGPPTPPTQNVNVVNTPLDVTVENTPDVNVANTVDVDVQSMPDISVDEPPVQRYYDNSLAFPNDVQTPGNAADFFCYFDVPEDQIAEVGALGGWTTRGDVKFLFVQYGIVTYYLVPRSSNVGGAWYFEANTAFFEDTGGLFEDPDGQFHDVRVWGMTDDAGGASDGTAAGNCTVIGKLFAVP